MLSHPQVHIYKSETLRNNDSFQNNPKEFERGTSIYNIITQETLRNNIAFKTIWRNLREEPFRYIYGVKVFSLKPLRIIFENILLRNVTDLYIYTFTPRYSQNYPSLMDMKV